MANCERINICPFFSGCMANMPSTAEVMKNCYCRGDKTLCARYQVALAGFPVPSDLFPQQTERAQQIVARK